MTDALRIPYKSRPMVMIFAVLFFLVCAIVLAQMALGDAPNESRRLRGFSPETARWVLWFLVVFSVGVVIAGLLALLTKNEIVIENGVLRAPKSPVSRKIQTVRLSDLSDMQITVAAKQRFLRMEHPNGRLSLVENALPKGMTAEMLAEEIAKARSMIAE